MNYSTEPGETPASLPEPSGKGGSIALDIETINLVEQPDLDFQSPEHWTVFAVPLGHRPTGTTEIETTVLFRKGPSPCDELDLILRTAAWIRDRKPDRLLTYNGAKFDIPILRHRASVTAHECPGSHHADLSLLFDTIPHTDLYQIVKETTRRNTSLDEALDDHGIDVTNVLLDGERITGGGLPELGMRILSDEASNKEYQAVIEYAESDVEPLFALHDSFDS